MELASYEIEVRRVSRGVVLEEVPRHTAVLDGLDGGLLLEVHRICHHARHGESRNHNGPEISGHHRRDSSLGRIKILGAGGEQRRSMGGLSLRYMRFPRRDILFQAATTACSSPAGNSHPLLSHPPARLLMAILRTFHLMAGRAVLGASRLRR